MPVRGSLHLFWVGLKFTDLGGELADEGVRRDVTVTDGGRRGDGPPERAAVRDVLTD